MPRNRRLGGGYTRAAAAKATVNGQCHRKQTAGRGNLVGKGEKAG